MIRLFDVPRGNQKKLRYPKAEKARIIVNAYNMVQGNLMNGDVAGLVKNVADYYDVHHVTMRYWLQHYEAWKHNPSHTHICIDGVKSEISKYELERLSHE